MSNETNSKVKPDLSDILNRFKPTGEQETTASRLGETQARILEAKDQHNKVITRFVDIFEREIKGLREDFRITAKTEGKDNTSLLGSVGGLIKAVGALGGALLVGYSIFKGFGEADDRTVANPYIDQSDENQVGNARLSYALGGTLSNTLFTLPDLALSAVGVKSNIADTMTPVLSLAASPIAGLLGMMGGTNAVPTGPSGLSTRRYGDQNKPARANVNPEHEALVDAIDDLTRAVEFQSSSLIRVLNRPSRTIQNQTTNIPSVPNANMPVTSGSVTPAPRIQATPVSIPSQTITHSAPGALPAKGNQALYDAGGVIPENLRNAAWRGDAAAIRTIYNQYGPGVISLLSESGGRGAGEVSKGSTWGDRGGDSFGIPQFTSVFMGRDGSSRPGSVFGFLNSPQGAQFRPAFEELAKKLNVPYGSVALSTNPAFGETWKRLAATNTAEFTKAQLDFSTNEYENPQLKRLAAQGINLDLERRPILRELTRGLSQFGRAGDTAIIKAFAGRDISNVSEAELVEQLTKARIETVGQVFQSSNAQIQESHRARARREGGQARALLTQPVGTTATASTPAPSAPRSAAAAPNPTPTMASNAGSGKYIVPTKGPITSPFGPRIHPVTKEARMHSGIDFGAPSGQPIFAAAGGDATFVGTQQGYGNIVILRHGDGSSTRYAHMSTFDIKKGDTVQQGQLIGKVGNTGLSTGPHLHYEERDPSGKALQPSFGGAGSTNATATAPTNVVTGAGSVTPNSESNMERSVAGGNAPQPVVAAPTPRPPPPVTLTQRTRPNLGSAKDEMAMA